MHCSSPPSLFHFHRSSLSSNVSFAFPRPSISPSYHHRRLRVSASANNNPILKAIKTSAGTLVLTAAAVFMMGKFRALPARAESPMVLSEESATPEEKSEESSPLSEFLENSEALGALKSVLQQKLEDGEDGEALKVLERLVSAQPEVVEWKFLMARLLGEMGETDRARDVFEEILASNPLSFEALFGNALLMDQCGEGDAVIRRLEDALRTAENENKLKEARDVRLIMAQMQFLRKNVDEALRSYEELEKEDPSDFRPYFCKGMIYTLQDRNEEAREQFAKYRERSPKKFEVEGFLQTPLSRMKLFGTDSES
ncbi:hypothetical protein VitviT2T_001309 [Vitis vinifera]|uniref:Protein SLOW GREEN 1, chloroplastic n=2 Tax=Vitis vinifera TaxID=29760 RepID=A0ABY9BF75_VITVI|nr:protein SLOW GREEN 1, chloroplastic [Vitis vinifera]WJZ81468.1 hypothetical protein VitviT2T_001309 [Vitis vinifera]|eukprot:XP_003631345.1 PREDICTED: protein SLOW GREEN 1, chloroplastic [Vitis vinifera]